MTEPQMAILAPTPCEWCSTGLYQRKLAEFLMQTAIPGVTAARLCAGCADTIGDGPRIALVPVADLMPLIDAEFAAAYLARQEWTTARSVPEYPHQYLLLPRSDDPLTHLRVVRWIRATGERRKWSPAAGPAAGRAVWCHYRRSGAHEYWTQPSEADPIINRAER